VKKREEKIKKKKKKELRKKQKKPLTVNRSDIELLFVAEYLVWSQLLFSLKCFLCSETHSFSREARKVNLKMLFRRKA